MNTYYMNASELSAAIGSYNSDLTVSSTQSDSTLKSLNDFSSSSVSTLIGDVWDDIRGNLDNYSDCLELSNQVNETINQTNKECLEMIQNFLQPDGELNTADLPQFEAQRDSLEAQIAALEAEIASLQAQLSPPPQICSTDSEGHEHCEDDTAAIAAIEAAIEVAQNKIAELQPILDETNRLINKINQFNNVVLPAVMKKLEAAQMALKQFIDEVDKITLSMNGDSSLRKEFDKMFKDGISLDKFSSNPKNGFELWLSKNKYTMEDFKNSALRGLVDENGNNNGYTPEQAYEAFIGVIIAEAGSKKSLDEILAVASVALNRCDENYDNNGNNPFDQMFSNGGDQYETITAIDKYYSGSGVTDQNGRPINPYEVYMPSIMGRDKVDAELAKHGDVTYDEIKEVVDLAMNGLRNNDFDQFVAAEDIANSNVLNNGGNSYTYSKYDQGSMDALYSRKAARDTVSVGGTILKVEKGASLEQLSLPSNSQGNSQETVFSSPVIATQSNNNDNSVIDNTGSSVGPIVETSTSKKNGVVDSTEFNKEINMNGVHATIDSSSNTQTPRKTVGNIADFQIDAVTGAAPKVEAPTSQKNGVVDSTKLNGAINADGVHATIDSSSNTQTPRKTVGNIADFQIDAVTGAAPKVEAPISSDDTYVKKVDWNGLLNGGKKPGPTDYSAPSIPKIEVPVSDTPSATDSLSYTQNSNNGYNGNNGNYSNNGSSSYGGNTSGGNNSFWDFLSSSAGISTMNNTVVNTNTPSSVNTNTQTVESPIVNTTPSSSTSTVVSSTPTSNVVVNPMPTISVSRPADVPSYEVTSPVETTSPVDITPTVETPIINEMPSSTETFVPPVDNSSVTVSSSNNGGIGKSILTAAGVTAAVGAAAGAVYYGVNQAKKNNEFDEELDEDSNEI